MQLRGMVLASVLVCLAVPSAPAQTAPESGSGPVIRAEARLVLIDTVVTDKKGNYIRDLVAKDFRVWEDNKEQSVTTFSYESDAASPNRSRPHYLVLFFDLSTMQPADQQIARQAAVKFLDANAGDPGRLIAIVNFTGALRIAQNFTADAAKLKQVAAATRFSTTSTAGADTVQVAALGAPSLSSIEGNFGVRTSILALRKLAKSLAAVPGRKTLVLLTAGFPVTAESRPELTAAIDECNRANVSVYPIDVRGLTAPGAIVPRSSLDVPVRLASFVTAFAQRPGGGGGGTPGGRGPGGGGDNPGGGGSRGPGGGGTPGGPGGGGSGGGKGGGTPGAGTPGGGSGSGGSKPGTGSGTPGTGTGGKTGGGSGNTGRGTSPYGPNQPYYNSPMSQPRIIIPVAPPSASDNQQVMYMLADGTGGFVIVNTNDLLGGLQKISREQNEYYVVGYSPAESEEGSCHTLRVKVSRGGTVVRARSGYCNARPVDLLAGKPPGKQLEDLAAAAQPGNLSASMMLPYFYASANLARVDVAIELPPDAFKFEKVKGRQHTEINLLGIAYRPDGTVAGRFSDTVKLDLEDKKAVEAFRKEPLHYENQFEIAPGRYNLKVVFGASREKFGKLEMPLAIEPWDGKHIALSGIVLTTRFHPVTEMETGMDAEMLDGKTPLVAGGLRFIPSGGSRFKTTDKAAMFMEVYAPALVADPGAGVALQIRMVNRKSGQAPPWMTLSLARFVHAGNPVIPAVFRIPIDTLAAGPYRAELQALDALGNTSPIQGSDFEVE